MPDNIELIIGSKQIIDFISYSVESDIFTAADYFRFEIYNPEINITAGQQCKLSVNGNLELVGIVERIQHSWNKNGQKMIIEGRDLMGLIVDSYVEVFETKEDISLKELAELLLVDVPFISRKNIIYGKGDKIGTRTLVEDNSKDFFAKHTFVQIKPGHTVFEILNDYAKTRGLIFFNMPDGTFVFGEPITSGKAAYSMICRKTDSINNNAMEGENITDISRKYKKVTVLMQRQGTDPFSTSDINVSGISEDPDFPFAKPFIQVSDNDGLTPEREAKLIMEQQRFEALKLQYKTNGHSQRGNNYQVNTICHVEDEIFNINKDFLVYSRTFEMNKNDGVFTKLKLSELGILPL